MLNKKVLLSSLIAWGGIVFFACSDEAGDACINNETRCEGLTFQTCHDGEWKDVEQCANTCDPTNGCNNSCTKSEAQETSCTDGKDNDCDGKIDSADSDCGAPLEKCSEIKGADCQDCIPSCYVDENRAFLCVRGKIVEWYCNGCFTCSGMTVTCASCFCNDCSKTEDKESTCDDGIDNDCDGFVDSDDYDCPKEVGDPCPTTKGAPCDQNCPPVCSADNSHAYVCDKSGTVMEWTCANNVCSVSGSSVICPE